MGTIKVNEQVLRDAVEAIELDLEHWDQVHFFDNTPECGTTACLAGHIAARAMHLDLDTAMQQVPYLNVPVAALDALGVTDEYERRTFHLLVFCYTHEDIDGEDGNRLGGNPAALKLFKKRITEMTGVEF